MKNFTGINTRVEFEQQTFKPVTFTVTIKTKNALMWFKEDMAAICNDKVTGVKSSVLYDMSEAFSE